MEKFEQRISPAGFARLQKTLADAESRGHGPHAAAVMALHSVGLKAEPGIELVFVVDPDLDGPIYPFGEWPAELAAERDRE